MFNNIFNPDLLSGKDLAYWERNQLVCYLSKIYPSHLVKQEDEFIDKEFENIICIHFPEGNATWHINNSELIYFQHLKYQKNHWDGHSLKEKYEKLLKKRLK